MSEDKFALQKRIFKILLLAALYFLAANIGLKLAFVQANATPVWPPTGIAFAALLFFGYKLWPGILLGAFLANITTAGTILTSLGIASGNTLEAIAGVYLINRFAGGKKVFDYPKNIFLFVLFAGFLATLISATVGVSSLTIGGFSEAGNFFPVWFTWWLGDINGNLIFAPLFFLLLKGAENRRIIDPGRLAETILLFLSAFFVSEILFGKIFELPNYPLEFMIVPVLIWSAFRFTQLETSAIVFMFSIISVLGTLNGWGPFAQSSPNVSFLLLQAFTATISITSLAGGAVVAQRNEFEAEEKKLDLVKNEFLNLATHQLRNPLTVIKWNTELIFDKYKDAISDDVLKHLKDIYDTNQLLIDSMDTIFTVSRLELGEYVVEQKLSSLTDIADKILMDLGPLIHSNRMRINSIYSKNMPQIKLDVTSIKLIFKTLVSNAIKYGREGSEIEFSIASIDNNIFIKVSNEGIGIPDYEKNFIFSKLFRGENIKLKHKHGMGLDLYIAKTVVEKLGGKIWFESEEHKQTSFFVSLPINA